MKGWRKVHIDGKEWLYRIGKSFFVAQSPNGTKKTIPLTDLVPGCDIERERWKGNSHLITPAVIKDRLTSWQYEFGE